MKPAAKRMLIYFLAILLIAAAFTLYRGGAERASAGTIAAALLFAVVCAALVWLRWDWAPRSSRQRRDGGPSPSEPDVP